MGRRGAAELMIEILEACKKGTNISAIIHHHSISMEALKPLIASLCQEGYITWYPAKPKTPPCRRKNSVFTRKRYQTTEKGLELLKAISPLVELINKHRSVNRQ